MTAPSPATPRARAIRALFVLAIFGGSFLLFLIQPMIARMALPVLGGAPNVWNSAMVVFQVLLLGGYAYAHLLSRLPVKRQAGIHLALLGLAALTLPIALAGLPPPVSGWEAVWAPALIAASVGPVFFVVSAQASLLQRWFAERPGAGDPYALYAASNLGSFAGLIAYPFWLEPAMALGAQSRWWAFGYLAVALLIAASALTLRNAIDAPRHDAPADSAPPERRTALLWFVLAAVPSGLMLSTTTLLTTDIMAMPLLWVIPLGLYLLSYTLAFSESGDWADVFTRFAPVLLLAGGSLALISGGQSNPAVALVMAGLLFVLAVALHRRLYTLRPDPRHLTWFYLVAAAGGAAGGFFVAIVAPLLFDWIYEHAILLLAAAMLLPLRPFVARLGAFWREHPRGRAVAALLVLGAAGLAWALFEATRTGTGDTILLLVVALTLIGIALIGLRAAFVAVAALLMLGHGGASTIATSFAGDRSRSYFGAYAVEAIEGGRMRQLTHGTTIHGSQWLAPGRRTEPTAYYGRSAGIGLALAETAPDARVGVVGLGAGTLACYRKPGQAWTFYEIDPQIAEYSRRGVFTFLDECAPEARMVIGDARLELARDERGAFDLLAIDAFSSDSIPLHLMTREAFATYGRALAEDGLLLVHISNRFIDLAPMVAAQAKAGGWRGRLRLDNEGLAPGLKASLWVVLARDEARLEAVDGAWEPLPEPARQPWTDDNASILPLLR
jgi:SAM-dependent methyltransferase